MKLQTLLITSIVGTISLSFATPVALPQGTGTGSDSCPSDPLNVDTWKTLDVDTFLKDWTAKNVTVTATNNVQSLADSFGAPNFFCGLDNFCNAGQPCLPVQLPAWYVMVAVQNWNSYMNSMNTAISFASSIASLTLPSIVEDFYPKPKDDLTPLKDIEKMFTTVLGVVPFVGPVSKVASGVTTGLNYVLTQVKPPVREDLFVKWSEISESIAIVVQDYQTAVSTSIKATLDAPVDEVNTGINSIVAGGGFLGVAQNFSQADLQSQVIDSINVYAISLTLQARKLFVVRNPQECTPGGETDFGSAGWCTVDPADSLKTVILTLLGSNGNGESIIQSDVADLLISKYGFTQEQVLVLPTECYDANNNQQLATPFGDTLPLDRNAQCLFNVLVCDRKPGSLDGSADYCRSQGLDV